MTETICIVCHDAGGAEILSSYVLKNKYNYRMVIDGPALNIFKRKVGDIQNFTPSEGLVGCDLVICGTSWQSNLEWEVIELAKSSGKKVVCYLDHWVNYNERFVRNNIRHMPDEIWVGDSYAEILAIKIFPESLVKYVENPYFEELKSQIAELVLKKTNSQSTNKKSEEKNILYVCENISEHAIKQYGDEYYWGYTEMDAVEYFFLNVENIEKNVTSIIIRPHPSESSDKYQSFIRKHQGVARLSERNSLLEEILWADVIVGCESMAMVLALFANKRVVSCIPPKGKQHSLPHKEIEIFHFN